MASNVTIDARTNLVDGLYRRFDEVQRFIKQIEDVAKDGVNNPEAGDLDGAIFRLKLIRISAKAAADEARTAKAIVSALADII